MSNFKWRDNHIPKFLELYQKEECIWNTKIEEYKNASMRTKSYENMRSGMGIEGLTLNDIKSKIKSIRTTYKVELNKLLKANKSGAGLDDLYKPKLFWFAQADTFLRAVCVARESQSNLVLINTEDQSRPGSPNPGAEAIIENLDEPSLEPTNLLETEQRREDFVRPSTSEGNGTTNKKRLIQVTSQSLPPKKKSKAANPFEQAIDKLQSLSDQCKEPVEDEFDLFGKSIAYQLKKMPLGRALVCQEKLQSVMTQDRLQQIASKSPAQDPTSPHYSASYSYPNSPPLQQYMPMGPSQNIPVFCTTLPSSVLNPPPDVHHTARQDIISQALMNISQFE